jgi:hypothetical protein
MKKRKVTRKRKDREKAKRLWVFDLAQGSTAPMAFIPTIGPQTSAKNLRSR